MRRLIALVLLAGLLCGCSLAEPTEPTQAPGVIALPQPLFPEETQRAAPESSQQSESIDDLVHLMDYAILLETLLDAGCRELCWDTPDLDGDGLPELTAQTFAGIGDHPSQIIADGFTLALEGFTAPIISQDTGFCRNEEGIFGLLSGNNSMGISDAHFYRWTGSHLQEVVEQPDPTEETGMPTMPKFHFYDPLFLSNPELDVLISPLEVHLTANIFHAAYLNRWLDMHALTGDLDGDGIEEYVFLLNGGANDYLARVTGMSFRGDEKFLDCYDRQVSAVVISTHADRTWIRLARLGPESMGEPELTENGLVIDERTYFYQSSGEPFLTADAAQTQTVQTDLVSLTLPDSWWNRYLYSCYERPEEDGFRGMVALVFREQTGYLSFGGGHLFSLILLPEDAPIDYPQYELLGKLVRADETYQVLAVYPSDVQYTEETQAAYTAMREDIPAILATLTPAEGAVFTPET